MTLLALMMLASLPAVRPAFASAVDGGGFEGLECFSNGLVMSCGAWIVTGNDLNEAAAIITSESHSGSASFLFDPLRTPSGNVLSQEIGVVASGETLAFWLKGSVQPGSNFGYRVTHTGTECGDNCIVAATLTNVVFSDWSQIKVDLSPLAGSDSTLEFFAGNSGGTCRPGITPCTSIFLDDVGITSSSFPDVLLMAQFPSDFDSTSMIVQAIGDAGLSFAGMLWSSTGNNVPDLSPYKAVVLTGTSGACCGLSDDMPALKSYVQNGGGLVILAGAIFQMRGFSLGADASWVGVSAVGYTGTETATISVNNPLGTSLLAGDVLKIMPPGSVGAQWVAGLQSGAVELAGWSGGNVFAYSFQSGSGRVFYQADRSPELAGQDGYNRLRALLGAGMKFAVGRAKQPSTISASVSRSSVSWEQSLNIFGSVSPPLVTQVTLAYTKPDSSILTRIVSSSSAGTYTDSFTPNSLGDWQVRASWAGDSDHTGATSSPATFTVNTQFMYTYHYQTFDSISNYDFGKDLNVASSVLNTARRASPLVVRVDIDWNKIQSRSTSAFNYSKIREIFDRVLASDNNLAYVILGTHSFPTDLGGDRGGQFGNTASANQFVVNVVSCIKGLINVPNCHNWEDKVVAWQVDNEPLFPDFLHSISQASSLATWLASVKHLSNKPTVINLYTTFLDSICGSGAWSTLNRYVVGFPGYAEAKSLYSNLDVMGIDVYPDQWVFTDEGGRQTCFNNALAGIQQELVTARNKYNFAGGWGIVEMPGGPRILKIPGIKVFTHVPEAKEIALWTKLALGTAIKPELVGFFQLKDGPLWNSLLGLRNNLGDSYGLVDCQETNCQSGLFRSDYLCAVEQSIPGARTSCTVLRIETTSDDLLLVDPAGKRVGIDPSTRGFVNEIPGAAYLGLGSELQVISIPSPLNGTYQIQMLGTNTSSFLFTTELSNPTQSNTQTFNGTILEGQILTVSATITSDEIAASPPTRVPASALVNKTSMSGYVKTEVEWLNTTVSKLNIRESVKARMLHKLSRAIQKIDKSMLADDSEDSNHLLKSAKKSLNAFAHIVSSQAGKSITASEASDLLTIVNLLKQDINAAISLP